MCVFYFDIFSNKLNLIEAACSIIATKVALKAHQFLLAEWMG
jgi:hypothetical protein